MARVTVVKRAQQRYETVPVLDAEGNPKTVQLMRRDGTPKLTRKGKPIFQRLTVADKSRPIPNRNCEKCGKEITVGSSYKWTKPKSGPYGGRMRVRCLDCPSWRPSETTGSQALSILYGAQEAAEDAIGDWDRETADDLKQILTDLAEGVREAGETYRESASNIEDGFGHETMQSQELNDKADELDGQADAVESGADDIEDFDEDAAIEEVQEDVLAEYVGEFEPGDIEGDGEIESLEDAVEKIADFDEAEYQRRVETAVDEKRDEWADEAVEKAEAAIGEAQGV